MDEPRENPRAELLVGLQDELDRLRGEKPLPGISVPVVIAILGLAVAWSLSLEEWRVVLLVMAVPAGIWGGT